MGQMFLVRSSPCPAPNLQSSPPLHAACSAVARRLPPPRPHLATHRMPSVRLPAVRAGVQPTAELRHLQRHGHAQHVLWIRALLPVPCSQPAVEPSPARCVRRGRPPPPASRLVYLAPHRMPSCSDSRQGGSAFNQPLSFDTSSVTSMYSMFHVRFSPCPAPNLPSSPLPNAVRAPPSPAALPPPGPHLAAHRMPSVRLPAVRFGVQPAAELRHVQRHEHGLHVRGAFLPVPCSQSAVKPSPERCAPRRRARHLPRPPWPAPCPALYALLSTRQNANSLSNANKLLIRCAWAGTSAFASAGYGSSWGPGTCPA